jgi:hypothetical protein
MRHSGRGCQREPMTKSNFYSIRKASFVCGTVLAGLISSSALPANAAPTKDFTIGPSGPSLAIHAGNTVRIPIVIKRTPGFTKAVKFEITNPFQGVSATKVDVTRSSMTLVVTALPDVTLQRGELVVTARGGGKQHALFVTSAFLPAATAPNPPTSPSAPTSDGPSDSPASPESPAGGAAVPPGFGVSAVASSTSNAVRNGDAIGFTLAIRRDGYSGPVRFVVANELPGVKYDFPYESVEGDDATLFVTADEKAAPGSYLVQLTVTAGGKRIVVPIPLTIV